MKMEYAQRDEYGVKGKIDRKRKGSRAYSYSNKQERFRNKIYPFSIRNNYRFPINLIFGWNWFFDIKIRQIRIKNSIDTKWNVAVINKTLPLFFVCSGRKYELDVCTYK